MLKKTVNTAFVHEAIYHQPGLPVEDRMANLALSAGEH